MLRRKYISKGFTVIELLVVIAVIGLLGSIIIISTQRAKESANEKRAMQFSASVHQSLGADLIGWWSFDSFASGVIVNGTQIPDNSGNGKGATTDCLGGTITSINGIFRQAINITADEDDSCIIRISNSLFTFTKSVTVEAWVRPTSTSEDVDLLRYNPSSGRFEFSYEAGGNITLNFDNGSGGPSGENQDPNVSCPANKVIVGQWNHIAATINNPSTSDYGRMFVNGEELTSCTISDFRETDYINPPAGNNVTLGATNNVDRDHDIDEIRLYKVSLTAQDVQRNYAEGLWKRLAKANR